LSLSSSSRRRSEPNWGTLARELKRSFTVADPPDTGPLVVPMSMNVSANHNQSFAVSSLFVASDPFNDAITEYDFWNSGTGGGRFIINNQTLGQQ
jgi:hypothetical protein